MAFSICFIGCGNHAAKVHGPSLVRYAREHEGVALAACCDIDGVRAVRFARDFGFARTYSDIGEMLRAERPDAVGMAVPEAHTARLGAIVLRAGIPLLLEKPPGRTLEELHTLLEAQRHGGAPASVAFNRRHAPLARALRQRIAALPQGSVQCLLYDMLRVDRRDEDFSTTAIHAIDAVGHLLGLGYREVRFHYQPLPHIGPTVTNVYLDCTMHGGVVARINLCPVAGVLAERVQVHAQDHSLFLQLPLWQGPDAPGRLTHLVRDQAVLDASGEHICDGPEMFETDGFYDETRSFYEAVRAGQMHGNPLGSAAQAVEIAQCIRERRDIFIETRM